MVKLLSVALLFLTCTIQTSNAGTTRNMEVATTECSIEHAAYCHTFADCLSIDDDDAFECVCKVGYSGDGVFTCVDNDECSLTSDDHPCPSPETGGYCVNTFIHDPNEETASLEGYKCGCDPKTGVTDGPESDAHGPTTCSDVNECLDPTLNDCDTNAACTNTFGSFFCECLTGYNWTGNVCEEDTPEATELFPSAAPTNSAACLGIEVERLVSFDDFDDGSGVAHDWHNWAVDYTEQESFTTFLGRFDQSSDFPYKNFDIPTASQRVFISFDFLEIDSWDGDGTNGPDKLGILFESEAEGKSVTIDFGAFDYTIDESSRNGTIGSVSWTIDSTPIAQSPQGFLSFQDQKHFVSIEIGSDLYSDKGDTLKATIEWTLVGDVDESVGIDNFRVVACEDQVPSSAPSSMPSLSPSNNPTNEQPVGRHGSGGGVVVSPEVEIETEEEEEEEEECVEC